jgi:hypothetical protein
MKRTSTLAILLTGFYSTVTAHSWIECTDYRVTQGSDDANEWNPSLCFGRPRCGKRQMDSGFGMDTGFNFKSKETCQCPRSQETYQEIPKAKYTPGQKICLAYPAKNHVAADCTNEYIPDKGVIISRTSLNPTSDSFQEQYDHSNGGHVFGQKDYKGFQNCPNFCQEKDKALCTMCFTLENDLTPGEYAFRWLWSFNSLDDVYTTCWDAIVMEGNGGSIPSSPSSTSSTSFSPVIAPSSSSSASSHEKCG